MAMNEQTVAETEEVAKPTSETGSAPDEYEQLLNEYSQDVKPVQEPKPESTDDTQELLEWAREQRQVQARQAFDHELTTAANAVKELVGDTNMSDRMVKGYLNALADEDPRIKKAWENRAAKPDAWKAALKKVAAEIQKDFPADRGLSEDRAAMTAAIRGAQPKTEAAPDVQKMSSADFNKHLRELGINP